MFMRQGRCDTGALLVLAAAINLCACVVTPPKDTHFAGEAFANPAPAAARFPHLGVMPGSGVLMSWVEGSPDASVLKYSVLREGHWGPVGEAAHGVGWFLNWSDFPSVTPIDDHFWVAHWQVRHLGGDAFAYDIAVSVSNDGGGQLARDKHATSRPRRGRAWLCIRCTIWGGGGLALA